MLMASNYINFPFALSHSLYLVDSIERVGKKEVYSNNHKERLKASEGEALCGGRKREIHCN
jgi:hypothetical protein